MNNLFLEIGLVIITASILALLFNLLRQPIVLAYIATGVVLGPLVLGFIPSDESIATLSHFGIAFLLFLVGLELDLRKLKNIGLSILIVAIGQIVLTFTIFYLLFNLIDFSNIQALFFALALTISSTVIIVKLLSEKNDLNALYGKISIGVLLLQDVIAILGIILLNSLSQTAELTGTFSFVNHALLLVGNGILLLLGVWIFARFVLPRIFTLIAKTHELLFISSIAWCFIVSLSAYLLGLSVEVGAFIAGISLAILPYTLEIIARIKPLRDFFIILFFVALGTQIEVSGFVNSWPTILFFCLLVLILKPLISMVVCSAAGYKNRTSFLASGSLGQISEFSFIAALLALSYGLISKSDLTIITSVGIITIAISSYFIVHGEKLYRTFRKNLKVFERLQLRKFEEPSLIEKLENHIVIFGCKRTGKKILRTLRHYGQKVVAVDFDPETIKELKEKNIPCVYGDMNDIEILDSLSLEKAKIVISTVDNEQDNYLLLEVTKRKNKKLLFFVTARTVEEGLDLYKKGVDLVIVPHLLSGEHLSQLFRGYSGKTDKLCEHRARIKEQGIRELEKYLS